IQFNSIIQIITYGVKMASIDYFECEDCGFKWKDQGPLFFFLNEKEEIEEYILLRNIMDLDKDSPISGDIVETYCANCDRKIKIYVISFIKKPLNEEEAIDLIESLASENKISNEHLRPYIRKSDLKDDGFLVDLSRNFHSSKGYSCPNCNSEIPKHILSRNACPKCGGIIKVVDGMCLDKL
ncbi:MAG: hypothetical protein MJ235_07650, partial [archaeon]|nr:hypothetical protein [archaeon]